MTNKAVVPELIEREMLDHPEEWSVQVFAFARDCSCLHCRRVHAPGEITHAFFASSRAINDLVTRGQVRFPLCNRCHAPMLT